MMTDNRDMLTVKHCVNHDEPQDYEGKLLIIKPEKLKLQFRNPVVQYFYATRHVFSYKNDFWLIEFIYNMRGGNHVFIAPHLKAEVVSGLGRY